MNDAAAPPMPSLNPLHPILFLSFSSGIFDGIRLFFLFESYLGGFSRLFSTWDSKDAKVFESCRSRKMLKNDALVAKFGFDTAENEPSKVL